MTLEISQRKLELALEEYEDNHDEGLEVRTTYSGRGMYGKNCLGVVGATDDLLRFVLEIVPAIDPISVKMGTDMSAMYSEEWFRVHTDDMGVWTIFYWPEIEVVKDEPDDQHPADQRYEASDTN